MRWTVVLPVKGQAGKSRLQAGDARAALAIAFARDAITAALECTEVDRVVVVTADDDVADGLPGVDVVFDPGSGLRVAIEAGIATTPGDVPAAIVLADLPALTPDALGDALVLARDEQRSFVPDSLLTGTTMLAAQRADALRPRFGEGSALRHRAEGHVELPVPASSGLRVDVDELSDLHLALDLGVGPYTRAVLDGARLAGAA